MVGDFNEVRWSEDRDGRGLFDQAGANDFNSVISGLFELDTINEYYT